MFSPVAKTDAAGQYSLKSDSGGIMPGPYRVTFQPDEETNESGTPSEPVKVPLSYREHGTTDVNVLVLYGGPHTLDLSLESVGH